MGGLTKEVKARLIDTGRWDQYVALSKRIASEELMGKEKAKAEALRRMDPDLAAKNEESKVYDAARGANICSYTETVRWAYVNSGMDVKPTIDDAPSTEAWVLYNEFKKDPDRRWEAYKQIISAKVRKEELEEVSNDAKWDGKAEYDILGAMAMEFGIELTPAEKKAEAAK